MCRKGMFNKAHYQILSKMPSFLAAVFGSKTAFKTV
jgi:hypothetical protein